MTILHTIQSEPKIYLQKWYDPALAYFFRLAASGFVPLSLFAPKLPNEQDRKKVDGHFDLEIISHCWMYSNMLAYQLSSFVNYPPTKLTVTVTVFYSKEDTETQELLNYFEKIRVENVIWNWQALPKEQLFRRGIGRNKAALATNADWVWFTDCDIIFHEGCLDSTAEQLQGKTDTLVFPFSERATPMLAQNDPMLQKGRKPQLVNIESEEFLTLHRDRAKGEYQIVHGDVARAGGYCSTLSIYQTPSPTWCKCYDDRAYRWLLGTQGVGLEISGCYQIRHVQKGRYKKGSVWTNLRSKIRHLQARVREPSE